MTNQAIAEINRRRNLQKLDGAVIVARLYCEGQSLKEIAERLGISRHAAGRAMELARKTWLERIADSVEAMRAEQLAKIDRIEAEAWEAWHKSKRAAIELSLEKSTDEEGDTKKKKRIKKFRDGEVRFLELASKQVEMRIKLLGLDEPESTGASSIPLLEVVVSSRAEAARMLPYMAFANETGLVIEGNVVDGENPGN